MPFRFENNRFFYKIAPQNLGEQVMRDIAGEEYIAWCPPRYKVLRYFDMGRNWRVSQIEDIKSHKRYLLKNLKNPDNTEELFAITRIQGVLFREFSDDYISLPRIIEAGFNDCGANYVIEEEKFGLKAGKEIINSLCKKERSNFIRHMSTFIYKLHTNENAAKFMGFRKRLASNACPGEDRYYAHLIHQNYTIGCRAPMIHGDLAPRNVLFSGENKVSIIDWGEARIDYAFIEFDNMYADKYGFGPHIVDQIAEEYCFLLETEYNLRKNLVCTTAVVVDKIKRHAKPTDIHRLPMEMRKRLGDCRQR